jgi:hypothetical protein
LDWSRWACCAWLRAFCGMYVWSEVLRCITSIYRQDFRKMIIPSKDITAGLCVYKSRVDRNLFNCL